MIEETQCFVSFADDFDDDFPIAKCTALYDYKAEQNDELSFKMGKFKDFHLDVLWNPP